MNIMFRDLKRQYDHIGKQIDERMAKVIASTSFISGKEVGELEKTLSDYVGVKHCISCANGTDAITIALMAHGVGEGDAVFVPDFTFFSSGECPASIGATPIFIDVQPSSYNIDSVSLEREVKRVINEGVLKPRAVVAVDLFGQPFDYEEVESVCKKYDLLLLEDGAQGFGGNYILKSGERKMACSLGDISTTSFFPAKPLGCYGDGGAIFTNDDDIALLCRSLAVHGKDTQNLDDPNSKYNNVRLGMNSRLDTLQAAVLLGKFSTFVNEELRAINHVADVYSSLLKDIPHITLPNIGDCKYSSWAQYTIQLPDSFDRTFIQKKLKEEGIPTNIYYVKPMHLQGAFIGTPSAQADCPITEMLCKTVLCLPIHPYLLDEEIVYITEKIKEVLSIQH